MRPITSMLGPGTVAQRTALINIDNYATAVLGIQIVPTGGAAFMLEHSFDDPCDLVNPVPLASMFWDHSLLPDDAYIGSAPISCQVMAAPLWFRFIMTNNVGAVRATFAQIGEHSHSNISQGAFAPPIIAAHDEMPDGDNFAAAK